jgi:4-hydroxy-tetrahydrodipicolinate synthase
VARDQDRARTLQKKARALDDLMGAGGRNPYAAVKAAMNILGLPGGYPRLPLRPLGEPHLGELRLGLASLGLLASEAAAE